MIKTISNKFAVRKMVELVGRFYPFNLLIRQSIIRARFWNEALLLSGKHQTYNTHPSIFFFTTQKCASMYVRGILKGLTGNSGMTCIDLEGYYFTTRKWPEEREGIYKFEELEQEVFKVCGYLYGPIRTYIPNIPNLDAYKIILMLRDPRDALTSLYFSLAYSHLVPYYNPAVAKPFLTRRKKVLGQTLDEFVLDQVDNWLDKYNVYCQQLLHKPNVILTKYEYMVGNFSAWLRDILEFLDLNVRAETVKEIIAQSNFEVKKESIYSNKRQVTPGDHKQKLKNETIYILNERFEHVLNLLNYSIEPQFEQKK